MDSADLHKEISAVAPIVGVSVGDKDDKSTWKLEFAKNVTDKQKQDALAIVAAFDFSAPSPKPTIDDRLARIDLTIAELKQALA